MCSDLNFPSFTVPSCRPVFSTHIAFLFLKVPYTPPKLRSFPCHYSPCLKCPLLLLTSSVTSQLKCHFLWKPSPALQVKSDPTVMVFQSIPDFFFIAIIGLLGHTCMVLNVCLPHSTASSTMAGPVSVVTMDSTVPRGAGGIINLQGE